MVNLVFLFNLKDFLSSNIYNIIYVALAIIVLIGIALMSKVKTAALGNGISALAMLVGIIVTFVKYDALPMWSIYVSLAIGTIIGLILALRVKMIEMPQLVALLNGVGGAASFIVGLFAMQGIGATTDAFGKITSLLAIAVGIITLAGSLVAAGKLHKVLPQKPIVYKHHELYTVLTLVLTFAAIIVGSFTNIFEPVIFSLIVTVVAGLFGYIFTIRVGGADMPITISLLNSFSGVAGAIAGLAILDPLLVAVGGIVGSSGLLLTQIMCKAMNRKLLDILLGKTTTVEKPKEKINVVKEEPKAKEEKKQESSYKQVLKVAKDVIIVPGYGMAIAQAQHLVKQLSDKLVDAGAKVRYAVHPVAGRMPGHMNVLLAEADVDYDDLYEMDDINPDFKNADLTIVVGANDVLNPAARDAEGTPIYGMPILNVDECKNVIIFNYDTKPGYAGVDNPLYEKLGVHLVLGNAFDTIKTVIEKL